MSEPAVKPRPRRRWARWGLIAVAIVAVVAGGLALLSGVGVGPTDFAAGRRVSLADYRGPDPTGVPASLGQASLIARGEYLAKAADCAVCHTAEGGAPFAGGLAFRLPFGVIYSTNITPDRATGIGGYSDAQFLAAVHSGVRADGTRLYPAMPYTSYAAMTDADALAIKAYLFSLQPVHAPARRDTLGFPFDQRWLMGMWSAVFSGHERFRPDLDQSADWNRGAYVAEALAHCGECHTPRNLAFGANNRQKFAGAVTAGWRAYNISGDAVSGIGGWSDDQVSAYLMNGHAEGHGAAAGPMAEAVDESFSQLAPQDIHAVVAYLRSVPGTRSSDLPATLAQPAPDRAKAGFGATDPRGKMVFEQACASCHSWSGVSPIIPMATLTGARSVNDPTATNVAQIVISGARRTTPTGVVVMPAFGKVYSDSEIAAVANYVTGRFGSQPAQITGRQVEALRRQTAQ